MTSPNVIGVLARAYVEDLEAALPLYRELAGGEEPHTFTFGTMRLAKVGAFLLIEGADDEVRTHAATVSVRDVQSVADAVVAHGGTLLDGPAPGPNGPRLIADHGDGVVFEYIQLDPDR